MRHMYTAMAAVSIALSLAGLASHGLLVAVFALVLLLADPAKD